MTHHQGEQSVNRFAIATEALLRRDLDPAFANDTTSVVFVAGPPLDDAALATWTGNAVQSQMDVIYLAFQPSREHLGPQRVAVFIERYGLAFRWTDCVLWAPADGSPLLIMPTATNVCFAYDSLALISLQDRPTKALDIGMARARKRLRRAASDLTPEQLARMEYGLQRAA